VCVYVREKESVCENEIESMCVCVQHPEQKWRFPIKVSREVPPTTKS